MFQRKFSKHVLVTGNKTNKMKYDGKKLRKKMLLSFRMKNVKLTTLVLVACVVIATIIFFFFKTPIKPGDIDLFIEFAAKESGSSGAIAVFYHVLSKKSMMGVPRVRSIVREQLSNLPPEKYKVFVRFIGKHFGIENVSHFQYVTEDSDIGTLKLLWEYCQINPTDKVVYIHSLGSWDSDEISHRMRRFATKGALSKECANLPDSCNVCASRMSPVPHPHAPGNMWLARCDYIKKLNDPTHFVDEMNEVEFSYKGNKHDAPLVFDSCKGLGGHAAAHWVYSHPKVMPCDLLSDSNKYVWNHYDIPDPHFRVDLKQAPRFDLQTYNVGQRQCEDWGLIVEDRLMEYHALYGEGAPKAWWGWKLFNATYTAGVTQNPLECKCVDCKADKECGGLWEGIPYPLDLDKNTNGDGDKSTSKHIHIVVTHCNSDLGWISNITNIYEIKSIYVISKCGNPVVGAPVVAKILELPNVGRCDHAYAYYISEILVQKTGVIDNAEDSVVFFLKEDFQLHQPGVPRSFGSMLSIASSANGFSCYVSPRGFLWTPDINNQFRSTVSTYHVKKELIKFSMGDYQSAKAYDGDGVTFRSNYDNLGSFYRSLDSKPMPDLVPVCYGGQFAASFSNIRKIKMSTWRKLESSLSRGNSIEEGHFAERLWAMLLSDPIEAYKAKALLEYSDFHFHHSDSLQPNTVIPGALAKRNNALK